ncbi:DHA2 family efflux MFS transporter permease subunit [Tomitella cavernea]|uniref:DHA2 family efflux MFS transporter permease subunit n=1 Tax=Tomitella cavernea TaxID=1387982 RepID=A0ABP9C3K4_9ACTN|nr:DHA2 family efflux MFS transporter permease subunit [Tomitella cavernea]
MTTNDTGTMDMQGSSAAEESAVGPRSGLIIGMLVVAAFVMILNETIVSVALPDLAKILDVSATTVQWLASGFLLTMAVVIPTTGFLLERFSPRAIFLTAMSLFSVGTLVCAASPNFEVLLAGRVVQAGGTAVMIPLLMTTVMRLVPEDKRGATMGTMAIVIGFAPALGPTVGGAILSGMGWRWMFWLVLILAAAMFAVGATRMHVPGETRKVPLDVASVIMSGLAFAGIVYGFSLIGRSGDTLMPAWAPIVAGLVVLGGFVWRQMVLQREDRPLLSLLPLGYRQFTVSVIVGVLVFMSLLGAGAILLPMYMQNVLGESTFITGLALLPGGLALAALSRPVGRLYDRVGARPLLIPGAAGMTAALWLFALLGEDSSVWAVIGIDILLMVALGVMMTPMMTEALGVLPDSLYSHGSAILTTLQQVAGALGSAVFVSVATLGSSGPILDADGMRLAFATAGAISIVAFVATLFLKRSAPAGGHGH